MFIVLIKTLVNDAASSRRISGASASARSKALVKTALAMAGSILEMMFVDGCMLLCKMVAQSKYAIGDTHSAIGRVGP